MSTKPTAEKAFDVAIDRRAHEREQLIRQLSPDDQRRVEELRKQHEAAVLERRQLQGAPRIEDIKEQRQKLVQEHLQPALRPDNAALGATAATEQAGRVASRMAAAGAALPMEHERQEGQV